MFVKPNSSKFRLLTLSITLLLLVGCSRSFVVTSEVPRPLIEKMPISAKLVYSKQFAEYVYVEPGRNRALDEVDFGQAQVGLFDSVFSELLTVVDESATEYDFKIEPQILDFQYSVPAETKIRAYEIWLKYRLKITDQQDTEVADWVVKGYGKTPTSTFGSQLGAFNTASNIALRDVGAQLAIGFRSQPSIEAYVAGNRNSATQEVSAEQVDTQVTDTQATTTGSQLDASEPEADNE